MSADLVSARPTYRFAPSPTGRLHLGNARTALWNHLLARREGGRLILRLDDTDAARSTQAFAAGIDEDLAWLGVVPDARVRQSDRLDRYALALDRLKTAGRAYPCYESPEELERARALRAAAGRPPRYDRRALALSPDERRALEAAGRRPHWRLRLSDGEVAWDDRVRGPSRIDLATLSDPVLAREDGAVLYAFASVVDDAELSVTDVLRGEDHVTNTAAQIDLATALGVPPPRFGHHNLLSPLSGEPMSKRSGALSLRSLRESGAEAMAVAGLAVLAGTSADVRAPAALADLAPLADPAILSRAPTRFDPAEVARLSADWLREAPLPAVADRLAALGIADEAAAAFWPAVRGNLARFAEAGDWWARLTGDLAAPAAAPEDAAFLRGAAAAMPPGPWDDATWGGWTKALGAASGRRGRALFHPLRLALTGAERGPGMAALLPIIGPERASARLVAATGG